MLPPYQFGVYDVLVLPPSFPFGGMVCDIGFIVCTRHAEESISGKRVFDIPHAE